MKPVRLILLRHAKSAWDTGAEDFKRPLAPRGRRAAALVGTHLTAQGYPLDHILCSAARRARETWKICSGLFPRPPTEALYESGLYHAGRRELLQRLAAIPTRRRCVLLIGHNPGLEDLLCWLLPDEPPRTAKGKLLTTGAVAVLGLESPWGRLERGKGELEALLRPKDLLRA